MAEEHPKETRKIPHEISEDTAKQAEKSFQGLFRISLLVAAIALALVVLVGLLYNTGGLQWGKAGLQQQTNIIPLECRHVSVFGKIGTEEQPLPPDCHIDDLDVISGGGVTLRSRKNVKVAIRPGQTNVEAPQGFEPSYIRANGIPALVSMKFSPR